MLVHRRLAALVAPALIVPALLLVTAGPGRGETVLSGTYIIIGPLCVGAQCGPGEGFANDADLKIKELDPRLTFEDTSTSGYTSSNDWMLVANEYAGPAGYFAIEDLTRDREVFRVGAGARANALVIADTNDGYVGFGTAFPRSDLHMVSGDTPAITFEQSTFYEYPPYSWNLQANHLGFMLNDETALTAPFSVKAGAEDDTLRLSSLGRVGLGLANPASTLHVRRIDGSAQIRVEEANHSVAPRTLAYLINNGRPEIVMANTGTGGEWSFGAGTNFILKQGAVGTASSAKTKLFEVRPSGDAHVTGKLFTGGTTCGGGCDAVFDPDYPLPDIRTHAAAMFARGYLPNVGPTPEGAPVDVTDKLGRMLNELEAAHVYIAELETRVQRMPELERQVARIPALEARLTALEARLSKE